MVTLFYVNISRHTFILKTVCIKRSELKPGICYLCYHSVLHFSYYDLVTENSQFDEECLFWEVILTFEEFHKIYGILRSTTENSSHYLSWNSGQLPDCYNVGQL